MFVRRFLDAVDELNGTFFAERIFALRKEQERAQAYPLDVSRREPGMGQVLVRQIPLLMPDELAGRTGA
jgi:hypothetical protein